MWRTESEKAIHFRLMNYAHIKVLYGVECCEDIMRRISEHFFFSGYSFLMCHADELIVLYDNGDNDNEFRLEDLARYFSSSVFFRAGTSVAPVVSLAEMLPDQQGSVDISNLRHLLPLPASLPNSPSFDHAWRAAYEVDMEVCQEVISFLECGKVVLSLQSVKHIQDNSVLYKEALLRFPENSKKLSTQQIVESFENVGLIRVIDHYVVRSVIDYLKESGSEVVACNVSAQSFVLDCWWVSIIQELSQRPDVSNRLILELTEGSNISSLRVFSSFAFEMQRMGVRIALDDFGVGMPRFVSIPKFKFDYIKIDKSLMAVESEGGLDKAVLRNLVSYLAFYCRGVIAEGVEDSYDLIVAKAVGVKYAQGFLIDTPSIDDVIKVKVVY